MEASIKSFFKSLTSSEIGFLTIFIISSIGFIGFSSTKIFYFHFTNYMSIIFGCISIIFASLLIYAHGNHISANSAICMPKQTEFGVINYGVDISNYTEDKAEYPATTFQDAKIAYTSATNAFKTGYFAWNGNVVKILTKDAHVLGLETMTKGNWWVFADLNNYFIEN